MNITCIGDSLTKGYGVAREYAWVTKLEEALNCPVNNKGVVGDTTAGILSRFTRDVVNNQSTHVILMAGSNDSIVGRSPRIIFNNIKKLIDEATANNITTIVLCAPKIHIELASQLWDKRIDYEKSNEIINSLNTLLKEYCLAQNITFLDLATLIPADTIYYTDGIHLSTQGNELIFNKVKDKLA